jgi:hypothetical protein
MWQFQKCHFYFQFLDIQELNNFFCVALHFVLLFIDFLDLRSNTNKRTKIRHTKKRLSPSLLNYQEQIYFFRGTDCIDTL